MKRITFFLPVIFVALALARCGPLPGATSDTVGIETIVQYLTSRIGLSTSQESQVRQIIATARQEDLEDRERFNNDPQAMTLASEGRFTNVERRITEILDPQQVQQFNDIRGTFRQMIMQQFSTGQ